MLESGSAHNDCALLNKTLCMKTVCVLFVYSLMPKKERLMVHVCSTFSLYEPSWHVFILHWYIFKIHTDDEWTWTCSSGYSAHALIMIVAKTTYIPNWSLLFLSDFTLSYFLTQQGHTSGSEVRLGGRRIAWQQQLRDSWPLLTLHALNTCVLTCFTSLFQITSLDSIKESISWHI